MSHRPGPLLRLLLLLYPASFRQRYGREVVELYRWRVKRGRVEGGALGGAVAWVRASSDLVAGGWRERWSTADLVFADAPRRRRAGEGTISTIRHDLRDAIRRLMRTPFFTLSATLIVALGIGANAAVFTVVDAVLLRPPPYEDPSRVVHVYQDSDDGEPTSTSYPAALDMATYTDVFSGVAAASYATVTWEAVDGPRRALIEFVNASYFPVFGVNPSRGRWFEPGYDEVGSGNYAVVSHHAWRTKFGSDPAVVGRTIRMNGQPVTVIGVGPEGFNGAGGAFVTDFWLSISSVGVGGAFRIANLERRQDHWYGVRARLAPGVSVAQAQSAMDALAARLAEDFPEINEGRGITVFGPDDVRLHPELDSRLVPAAAVLLGIVGLVLVLACTNLANLLIVRGLSRGHEVAIRRALGASRGRVARLVLAESSTLAFLGGIVGLLLGRWILGLTPLVAGPLAAAVGGAGDLDLSMDGRVLLFTLGLVMLTGILFGLAPALRSARSDLAGVLREEGRGSSAGKRSVMTRNVLVATQVAVSLVLLVGAALLTRSLANVQRVDPGVDVERLAFVQTSFGQGGVSAEERAVRVQEMLDRAAALPGVRSAAFTSRLPVQPGGSTTTVVEDYDPPSGTGSVELPFAIVGEDYFRTVGLQITEGRVFGPEDAQGTTPVVVVNETAARRFWAPGSPIGRRIRPQARPDEWAQVVGVVEDQKVSRLDEPPTPMLFYAASQSPSSGYVLVRTDGDPGALLPSLRAELRAVSPDLPLRALATLESRLSQSLLLNKVAAGVLATFSVLAVLLASLGIYAVVSFAVARRSSEMGIRIALGAARDQVIRMVMREMLATIVLGLAIGAGLAALAAPVLERALYQVSAVDGLSFGVGALVLAAVAALATYVPAVRAARADPVEALRVQ